MKTLVDTEAADTFAERTALQQAKRLRGTGLTMARGLLKLNTRYFATITRAIGYLSYGDISICNDLEGTKRHHARTATIALIVTNFVPLRQINRAIE